MQSLACQAVVPPTLSLVRSAFAFAAANVYGVTRRRLRRGDRRQGTGDRAIKAGCFFLEDFPGAVGGAVVDDNDFMRDASEF